MEESSVSPTLEELGIDRMTADERLLLAQEILESVREENPGSTLSPAKREELRRRAAELDANLDEVVSWEEVQASIQARFAK